MKHLFCSLMIKSSLSHSDYWKTKENTGEYIENVNTNIKSVDKCKCVTTEKL